MKDISISAIVAGFIAVLVGYTSSAAIIFQAAATIGADQAMITSWMSVLGYAMGITTIGLSLYYKAPILTAWSTPGAAILVTSLAGFSLPEAIGAFMLSAMLIALFGITGWFEKVMDKIPFAIAAALLAGVLGKFGMNMFVSMHTSWNIVLPMFFAYLLFRRWSKIYVIPMVFIFSMILSSLFGLSNYSQVELTVARLIWTSPEFSIGSILSIAIPLFVVTMASQNIPGIITIRSSGYDTPVSPAITWTGVTTFLLAPFGCFAINLAAITAAICAGENAHPDKSKRYIATISAGLVYIFTGVFAATIATLFATFPKAMVLALAGLALLATIATGLKQAMEEEKLREAALITFLVTLSGMTLWGIGSAFWGLVLGVSALALRKN